MSARILNRQRQDATVIAFAIANSGSRQIQVSGVLLDLPIVVVEEATSRSRTEEDGAVNPLAITAVLIAPKSSDRIAILLHSKRN
jgi:hypothetical protein